MIKPIMRTIRFGVLDLRKDGKKVKVLDVFQEIDKLDFISGQRYFETSEGINLEVILDTCTSYPIKGMIGDSRKKELPVIETHGRRDGLDLPSPDSGLFDGNHFLLIKNKYDLNIIAYEFNFYAPRISRLSQYICAKLPNLVNYCAINPIQDKDISSALKKFTNIRQISIRAHKSCSFQDLDGSLDSAFKSMHAVTDADNISISFSCKRGRRNPMEMTSFKNILPFLSSNTVQALLESFVIINHDAATGQNLPYNLLDLFLHDKTSVAPIDATHRSVDSKKMYKAIDDAIKKNKNIIDGIQT